MTYMPPPKNLSFLERLGLQKQDESAEGETAQKFYNRSRFADTLARVARSANNLSFEPDANFSARKTSEIAGRKDQRASNETAKFLASKGREDLAKAILAGSITGKQAFAQYKQEEATEKARKAAFEDQARLARLRANLRPKAGNANDAKFDLLKRMEIPANSELGRQFLLGIKPSAASSKSMRPANESEIAAYRTAMGIKDGEPLGAYLQVDEKGELHIDGKRSGTNVSVNVDTNKPEQLLSASDEETIKQQAKNDRVPVPVDKNDPTKGPQRNDEGNIIFKAVPGSQAEMDIANEELEKVKRNHIKLQQKEIDQDVIISAANDALKVLVGDDPDNPKYKKSTLERIATLDLPEAGVRGDAATKMGFASSQEAVNLQTALIPLKATIGFDRLARMRDASKTGGALGQISNKEITLLYNSLRNLDQKTDPEILHKNITDVVRIYTKVLNDPVSMAILSANSQEEADRLIDLYQIQQQGAEPPDGTSTFNVDGGVATIKPRE